MIVYELHIASPLPAGRFFGFVAAMSGLPRNPLKDAEKERMAKALRDNLKRRKAQARERASEAPAKTGHPSNSEAGVKD